MKKKWSKLSKGDEVVIDGLVYEIKKLSAGTATLVGTTGGFLRLKAEGKVEVPSEETAEERAERERIEAALHRSNQRVARDAREMRANVKAKAERERREAAWNKPADKAEKVVERELGASLVGVQDGEGQPFICPILDPSTIKAHLLIFHEYEAGDRLYATLQEMHEWMHGNDGDAIPTPHEHRPLRPVA